MEQELLKMAAGLFNNPEKWNSFLQLANFKDKIINQWNSKLKEGIINKIKLDDVWEFYEDGMQWFLREFGSGSLSIWLEGEQFSLYANPNLFDISMIDKKLRMPEYKSIRDCIPHKDIVPNGGYLFAEKGRFKFNNIYDNHFNSNQLAWFAGNETDEYIRQIESKLRPFFDKESTDLLIELNSLSKRQV